jgi:hypothetical protein
MELGAALIGSVSPGRPEHDQDPEGRVSAKRVGLSEKIMLDQAEA